MMYTIDTTKSDDKLKGCWNPECEGNVKGLHMDAIVSERQQTECLVVVEVALVVVLLVEELSSSPSS